MDGRVRSSPPPDAVMRLLDPAMRAVVPSPAGRLSPGLAVLRFRGRRTAPAGARTSAAARTPTWCAAAASRRAAASFVDDPALVGPAIRRVLDRGYEPSDAELAAVRHAVLLRPRVAPVSTYVVKTAGMEFLCYHRDRPGSVALRHELLEAHWSYMDRYATEMIARGPTLAGDGDTPTGSVHIVDLPDPAAARAFAFDEPNYQAGVYRDVLLRRWRNTLGCTMWDFPGGRSGGSRYLVLGLGTGPAADLAVPPDREELIAYGPLLSDDGFSWLGTAVLLRAPDPDTAGSVLTRDRYADVEVHDWQFGGRQ
jgi:uncharacterized protein YciI